MDADLALTHVKSLRQIADELQQNLNQAVPKGAAPSISGEQVVRILGYTTSMVILRAFATELMLKVLSFKKTGHYARGHDLRALFDDLDDDTKRIITDLGTIHGIAPLEQILERHKGDFVEWRYLMERNNASVGFLDLDKALDILIKVYHNKDFLKLCVSGSP